MRLIKQRRDHTHDKFSFKVWKKENNAPDDGWYIQIKTGNRQWMIAPNKPIYPKRARS